MFDWIYNNETLLWWVLLISIVSFLATLIIVPIILTWIPPDYFSSPTRHRMPWADRHHLIRIPLIVMKNILALLFIIAGILMIALPGQGILTIIVGMIMLDFPGKYHLERRIVSKRSVLRGINWIRAKANKPALILIVRDDE